MMNKTMPLAMAVAALMMAPTNAALAKVAPEEAAKLKTTLNPLGGEKAGNADGTIPAWTGEKVKGPKVAPGAHYPDPFADDKPLFTITAANMDKYKDNLSEGQIALLKIYPDSYKMHVYQSRRTATYPDWYAENTYKNALNASTTAGGDAVEGAKAGIPFPIPKDGSEVIWNHLLRFQGFYRHETLGQVVPDAGGSYTLGRVERWTVYPYYLSDPAAKGYDGSMLSVFVPVELAPPRTAGDAFLFHDWVNPVANPRNTWRYVAGQRRVRRAPSFEGDVPIPPSFGLRAIDEFDMYFGSPERYNWKLLGKKEIYIGYNSYKLTSPSLKVSDIVTPGHINPEYPRYELHRVWVVEATLKDGIRHIYSRRVKYLDEDSWNIVISDRYDQKGELWRTAHSHLQTFWEEPIVFTGLEVHHDILARRYNALPLMNEEPGTYQFFGEDQVPSPDFFTPASIRQLGVR